MMKGKRILVLAPHTDDGELGCGGSIARFIEEGADVSYIAFSTCPEFVPPEFSSDSLEYEVEEATSILGIPSSNLVICHYQNRHLSSQRQAILDLLIEFRKEHSPDVVFAPSIHDLHQDHQTVSMEALRAFKCDSILSYELPWDNISFSTQALIRLSKRNVEKKTEALSAYKTQARHEYFAPDFITSLARARGTQIRCEYAEAFEVVRMVL